PRRGGDELDATLGDRARCGSLKLGADLVDHDDLGHVVLDRLDHHRVLQQRSPDLHAASATDTRMWDVAVAAYLVRGVDDDDPLAQLVREKTRALTQHRGLSDARPAQQQDALTAHDDVADDLASAGDGPADTHRQAHDSARAVATRGDAWQRAREQLDLFVPVGGADLALVLAFGLAHPNEGTSPFSRTGFGTRTASSLTNKSCVSKTVNPRPRRASIMCES